jgi:flavin-dependent dehydrogenase
LTRVREDELDVVIVGGGPAGLTTALALVGRAPQILDRVVVLEKGTYPRDKYCAGAIGARGERILARLDALPVVPSVPVTGMSFQGAFGLAMQRTGPIGHVVRRLEFDHALAQIARARGVRVIDDAEAERVEMHDGGATVTTRVGAFRGRIVVGADGVGSVVRKAMGLGFGALRAQVLEVDTQRVPTDHARDVLHFDASDPSFVGYFWDFPTRIGGEDLVCRGIYHLREGGPVTSGAQDVDLREKLGARLAAMDLDIDRCKNKRFAERGLALGERLQDGPLLLAGEAAGIDPVTGEGIAQAIEYGAMAGEFLADALAGKRALHEWTARVRRSRLGIDLRIRRRILHTFFGPSRLAVHHLLATTPAAVRAGCRHFGAETQDTGDLAVLAWGTARIFLESVKRGWKTPRATSP